MSVELIINASLPETRIALMEDGEIQDLLIERPTDKGIVGNIYKGRVTRVLPGMQAAFVDIGLEKAAFLYVDDIYVHSEMLDEEESGASEATASAASTESAAQSETDSQSDSPVESSAAAETPMQGASSESAATAEEYSSENALPESQESDLESEQAEREEDFDRAESDEEDSEDDEDEEQGGPVKMGPPPSGDEDDDAPGDGNSDRPAGTIAPPSFAAQGQEPREQQAAEGGEEEFSDEDASSEQDAGEAPSSDAPQAGVGGEGGRRRRHRRGRRGGRGRNRRREGVPSEGGGQEIRPVSAAGSGAAPTTGSFPQAFHDQVTESGESISDRSSLGETSEPKALAEAPPVGLSGRPEVAAAPMERSGERKGSSVEARDFNSQRGRDRRIKPRASARAGRPQVNIQDLLKEGQEILVQVAKDPIATKGARLTCHISLPGRHLVCMPTIDHVGVSRRIERDDERRKLRDYVERVRPRNLGFIVRTASGRGQYEKRIKQDVDYLTRIWSEIREKASSVSAPALVYEDLNPVLRAIRDWVSDDIDKIVVDSRYHYNEILKFVSHFMPSLKSKVELYHGDIPIFDAYGISTELSRALERKVWLKSGGYIVVDQAEALVAIDVNTGRYVGKKNLEDTILKTNLEAVQEVAYQLRLRNCGGIIIIDLIDMEKEENKQRVYRALEEALKKDRARPSILKISELGLIEMTRKRTRDTIIRSLCEPCTHCEGKGFIKSKQTVAYEILREIEREGIEKDSGKVLVQAHADVIDVLAIDERETLDALERRYRKQIYLQSVMDFHPEQFEVAGDKRESEQKGGIRSSAEGDRNRDRERDRDRDRNRGGRGRDRDRGYRTDRTGASGGSKGIVPQPRSQGTIVPVPSVPAQGPVAPIAPKIQPVEERSGGDLEGENSGSGSGAQPRPGHEQASSSAPAAHPDEDHFSEEDRLAFLRAQAAQDAALARLRSGYEPRTGNGSSAAPANSGNGSGGFRGGERGPGGGSNGAGGSGGGKRRRGRRGGRGGGGRAPRDSKGGGSSRPEGAPTGPEGVPNP